ncbi:hypothetical protein U1839_16385 [Sphingomonas sp. RT2P30]|uniref:hypothetical protein n=1 Tax=Parasphingomonas halimpatiens TaxID=3096162 RepID=UPI002FCC0F7B
MAQHVEHNRMVPADSSPSLPTGGPTPATTKVRQLLRTGDELNGQPPVTGLRALGEKLAARAPAQRPAAAAIHSKPAHELAAARADDDHPMAREADAANRPPMPPPAAPLARPVAVSRLGGATVVQRVIGDNGDGKRVVNNKTQIQYIARKHLTKNAYTLEPVISGTKIYNISPRNKSYDLVSGEISPEGSGQDDAFTIDNDNAPQQDLEPINLSGEKNYDFAFRLDPTWQERVGERRKRVTAPVFEAQDDDPQYLKMLHTVYAQSEAEKSVVDKTTFGPGKGNQFPYSHLGLGLTVRLDRTGGESTPLKEQDSGTTVTPQDSLTPPSPSLQAPTLDITDAPTSTLQVPDSDSPVTTTKAPRRGRGKKKDAAKSEPKGVRINPRVSRTGGKDLKTEELAVLMAHHKDNEASFLAGLQGKPRKDIMDEEAYNDGVEAAATVLISDITDFPGNSALTEHLLGKVKTEEDYRQLFVGGRGGEHSFGALPSQNRATKLETSFERKKPYMTIGNLLDSKEENPFAISSATSNLGQIRKVHSMLQLDPSLFTTMAAEREAAESDAENEQGTAEPPKKRRKRDRSSTAPKQPVAKEDLSHFISAKMMQVHDKKSAEATEDGLEIFSDGEDDVHREVDRITSLPRSVAATRYAKMQIQIEKLQRKQQALLLRYPDLGQDPVAPTGQIEIEQEVDTGVDDDLPEVTLGKRKRTPLATTNNAETPVDFLSNPQGEGEGEGELQVDDDEMKS